METRHENRPDPGELIDSQYRCQIDRGAVAPISNRRAPSPHAALDFPG